MSSTIGVLALDMWKLMDPRIGETALEELTRSAEFVIAQQPVYELPRLLSARDDRMAIVVDEFGFAKGMITLEDIQETVVGDFVGVGFNIPGYVHRPKQLVEHIEDGQFLVDSRVAINEINDLLNASLPLNEAHTLGGLVMPRLRHLPSINESVVMSGYRFTVEDTDGRQLKKLRVEAC